MPERVSNTDIRLRIRLCENSLGRGDPHHMALLDLLDARAKIENVDREDRQARAEVMDLECVNGIKHCNPVRFRGECVYCAIEKAERERDEAAPVLEAARWISDYCRAWYESYQRQTGDPEGNPDSAPPIESVNRVIHVIREYDAARAATEEQKR